MQFPTFEYFLSVCKQLYAFDCFVQKRSLTGGHYSYQLRKIIETMVERGRAVEQDRNNFFLSIGFTTEGTVLPTAPVVTMGPAPVSGLIGQIKSSTLSSVPNTGSLDEAVTGTLEALAAGAPEHTSVPNNEGSGDDLWPFPFPQDPSESWSENGGYFCFEAKCSRALFRTEHCVLLVIHCLPSFTVSQIDLPAFFVLP